jgi:hypothetical protein
MEAFQSYFEQSLTDTDITVIFAGAFTDAKCDGMPTQKDIIRRGFLQSEQPSKDMQAACSQMVNQILSHELRYRRFYLQLIALWPNG